MDNGGPKPINRDRQQHLTEPERLSICLDIGLAGQAT